MKNMKDMLKTMSKQVLVLEEHMAQYVEYLDRVGR